MRLLNRRRKAVSSSHGQFVAHNTNKWFVSFDEPLRFREHPSICFSSSFFTRRVVSSSFELRLRQILSISSIKMIARGTLRDCENSSLMSFSLSPKYDESKSELDNEKKVQLASVETALAIVDFPVPKKKE